MDDRRMTSLRLLDTWGWSAPQTPPVSAYVHVPFCRHRCGYCNFSLLANREDLFERFLDAIEKELHGLETPRAVQTIFLGGGTPSLLPPPLMDRLLELLRHWLPIASGGEWSIEANPVDVDENALMLWRAGGINRVSIGGQSFDPRKLKSLERDHSPERLRDAIAMAKASMDSVSLDLIFAAPGETLSDWSLDIESAIASGVDHVSTYGLTYEKGARFWALREHQQLEIVPEDTELAMYEHVIDTLTASGWEHYEISNFAKPGHACRHNQAYWEGTPWWAFGPSAARYVGGVRSVNHRSVLTYLRRLEANESPVAEREVLSPDQAIRERFVFGMRQLRGVDWTELSQEADEALRQEFDRKIESHVAAGWMQRSGDRVRLTRQGLILSDSLWSHYL